MKDTTKILAELRTKMKDLPNGQGAIAAYIIPSDDAHQVMYRVMNGFIFVSIDIIIIGK